MLTLRKKNIEADFWPRLTKTTIKNSKIQIDWTKWIDEDEDLIRIVGKDYKASNYQVDEEDDYNEDGQDEEEDYADYDENDNH